MRSAPEDRAEDRGNDVEEHERLVRVTDGFAPRLVRLEHWRNGLNFHGGGEARHRRRLSEHLAQRGVETRLATILHDEDADGCDLLHAWNLQDPREALIALRWAKELNLATVVTPLLAKRGVLQRGHALTAKVMAASPSELDARIRSFVDGSLEAELRESGAIADEQLADAGSEDSQLVDARAEALELSDVVLCLSRGEMELLARDHSVPRKRIHVTTVGVDSQLGVGSGPTSANPSDPWDVVLVPTTRIEALKNQLAVVLAARELPYRFVITGDAHDTAYSQLCMALAGERVDFVGLYDEREIAVAMRRARVILHPSLLECASLALLEAAISGASLVASDVGSVREYLGATPRYVDPCSVASIVEGVRDAWESHDNEAPRRRELQMRAVGYDWERAASETVAALSTATPRLQALRLSGALA